MFHQKTLLLSMTMIVVLALALAACFPVAAPAPTATPAPQGGIIPNTGATALPPATVVTPAATALPTPTPTLAASALPAALVAPTLAPTATAAPTLVPSTATTAATSTPIPAAPAISAPAAPSEPVVQLIYPASGTTFPAGQQIVIQSAASGAAGLAHVDLWVDGTFYASAVNSLPGGTSMSVAQPWSTSSAGTHTLTVVAYDVLGRTSTPASVSVQALGAAAPTSGFSEPYGPDGRVVFQAGDAVQLSYWGSADAGVARLELWVDGQLVASDANPDSSTTMTVQHSWSSDTIGDHMLVVRVYDLQNQSSDSTPLDIGLTDRNAPSVSLGSPANNAQILAGQTVAVAVSATDSKGITRIELWTDNLLYNAWNSAQVVGQTPVSVSFAWISPAVGNHTLYVIAKDSVGLSTTTQTLMVTVVAPTVAPTITPMPTLAPTATPVPTMTPTATLAPTLAPTATLAPTLAPTATLAPTMTPTATLAPTMTPTATLAPTMTPTATLAPTLTPTATLAPTLTPTATLAPTMTPTATLAPTMTPTATLAPTLTPTATLAPTMTPTTTITPTVTLTVPVTDGGHH